MNMLPVMIVDDEKLAREDLQTFIDWESLGFYIVATAVNGRQALKMYAQYHPKIIFTDIKMPVMDGIEFSRELRKIDEETIIILLTAYEEFSYAKAAIRLGITDYVIKNEITPQSMEALLKKLRQRIEIVQKSSNILNDKLIENFFQSEDENKEMLGNKMLEKRFYYLMVEQNLPLNISEESSLAEFPVKKQDISEALRGLEYVHMKMEAVSNMRETTTTVILDTDFTSQNDSFQILYQNAVKVREFLIRRFDKNFTVFYTMEPLTLPGWKKLCKDNEKIFRQRYFKPEEVLVRITGVPEPEGQRENHRNDLLERFLRGQKEEPKDYIRKMYDDICAAYAEALIEGGVSAVEVENQFDVPYFIGDGIGPETVAFLTAAAEKIKTAFPEIPMGIHVLLNGGKQSLAIAKAVNAQFIRCYNLMNSYIANSGYVTAAAPELMRYRKNIGAEAAILTGTATGVAPDKDGIADIKKHLGIPLIIGSGLNIKNIDSIWPYADGAIIGSGFKKDGILSAPVDRDRVTEFMKCIE